MPAHDSSGIAGLKAAVIGGGVIGASWAALFLANHMKVVVSDPDPDIERKVRGLVAGAAPTLQGLGYADVDLGALAFEADLAAAVSSAQVVQENGPEKLDFKIGLWARIEAAAPRTALLFSSSSSIPATAQGRDMEEPGRLIVGHPFNPPHLMPLVEVVPGAASDPHHIEAALAFYRAVGKTALLIRKEVPGFVANRLQSAIFKECVSLVANGVVSVGDLDTIVTTSLGIRWATGGPFLSFDLGGGTGRFKHFADHLAPGMERLWQDAGTAAFDEPTVALLLEQVAEAYGGRSYEELVQARDRDQVAVINALTET